MANFGFKKTLNNLLKLPYVEFDSIAKHMRKTDKGFMKVNILKIKR